MVEPRQDFIYSRPDVAEIYTYANVVEFGAPDKYLYHPVVPVDPCAVAGVSPQAVSRGKVALYVNFKNSCHPISGLIKAPLEICTRLPGGNEPGQSYSRNIITIYPFEYSPTFPK